MELMKAHSQWSNRPADERFWSLADLLAASRAKHANSRTATVPVSGLRVYSDGENVRINGKAQSAALTHYAFGQLCNAAGAPAGYLRTLPAELAATNLSHGLKAREDWQARLLLRSDASGYTCAAATSDEYARIWDDSIVERLADLGDGWRPPPGRPAPVRGLATRTATADDVLRYGSHPSIGIREGDSIAPSGLYMSDRDLFVFLVDESKRIDVKGASLCRGFFLWNSEVGDKSLGICTFLFDAVCGNHIVWGARDVTELRIRHTGTADRRWGREITGELRRYADSSTSDDVARIERAQRVRLGETRQDVIDALFGRKSFALSKSVASAAYDLAERTPRYGDPRTAWGVAQGLTELSQQQPNADERVRLDRTAGKVLEIAF